MLALATVQVVWFYLCRVRCEMDLASFEAGLERTPFQYRLLLMAPLRWAHESSTLNHIARALSAQPAWFPVQLVPEQLLEAAIDLLAVAGTGLIVRELYRRASRTGLLLPYAYPLLLLMVAGCYTFLTMHDLRFVYDLPSLFFFAAGMLAIYAEAPLAVFAAIFCVGTLNRETTLFLLPMLLLAHRARAAEGARTRRAVATTVCLAVFWAAWHLWVVHRFHGNASAAGPRLLLNLQLLAMPLAWPQLFGASGLLVLFVVAGRRQLRDPVLRAWLAVLPVWLVFMLFFGLFLEVRIFGELIPLLACSALLLAEERLIDHAAQALLLPDATLPQRSSDVEATHHDAGLLAACVGFEQLRGDDGLLPRHQREIIVTVDRRQNAIP
jgi:hypothetical protein